MSLIFEERASDSPFVDTITHGWTIGDGYTIRPAEIHWHMVFTRYNGVMHPLVVGPASTSGVVTWTAGAEIIWIKFKLGSFMPHMPPMEIRDTETLLPEASSKSFWLKGAAWQIPDFENIDTFVSRLAHDDLLTHDTVVDTALKDHPQDVAERTVRHRFLRTTGLTQKHIQQYERAQRAAALLRQGVSILDTVFETGYFDQPHLTRSLKQFIGHTPAQILPRCQPD